MKTLLSTLVMLIALTVPVLCAAEGAELYSATVPVADHSDQERNRALRAGLVKVLVKLTGSAAIARSPEVQGLLSKAASYVLEFGYVELADGESGTQGLSVRYSRAELDAFLREAGLPVWPPMRAPLLVWVVRETGDQPQGFVTREDDEALYLLLDQSFGERGLPVRYPLYDLEDQLSLPVETAWSLQAEALATASARYGAVNWLVLRCYQSATEDWRLASVLARGGDTTLNSLEGGDLDGLLQTAVNEVVDSIAAGQTYIANLAAGQLTLEVTGVDSFASYTGMMDALGGFTMVRSMVIERVAGGRISLILDVEGEQRLLVDALRLSDRFTIPESPQVPGQGLSAVWRQPTGFR